MAIVMLQRNSDFAGVILNCYLAFLLRSTDVGSNWSETISEYFWTGFLHMTVHSVELTKTGVKWQKCFCVEIILDGVEFEKLLFLHTSSIATGQEQDLFILW